MAYGVNASRSGDILELLPVVCSFQFLPLMASGKSKPRIAFEYTDETAKKR